MITNNTVKIWIDLSISDLKTSRLLYEHEHFRNSYFYFQQATEKGNKALALLIGIFEEEDLKKIGHDQFKIYKKALVKQKESIQSFIEKLKPFPKVLNHKILSQIKFDECDKSLEESAIFIDSLRKLDLKHISTTELNCLLQHLKTIKAVEIKVPENLEKALKEYILDVADLIGQLETKETVELKLNFLKVINDEKLYNLIINQRIPLILMMWIDLVFINVTLYCCAIVTIQHSSSTRYPVNGTNPDDIYTKQLPIVEKQGDFMDLLDEALYRFKKISSI